MAKDPCTICGRDLKERGPYELGTEHAIDTWWHGRSVHADCPDWYRDNVVNYFVQLGRYVLAAQAVGTYDNQLFDRYQRVHEAIRNAIDTEEVAELLGPGFVQVLPEFDGCI